LRTCLVIGKRVEAATTATAIIFSIATEISGKAEVQDFRDASPQAAKQNAQIWRQETSATAGNKL
jgi:hypothetical protein